MGSVSPRIVEIDGDTAATGVNLTFTYEAAGEIAFPREFRVKVPDSWSAPVNTTAAADKGSFTVQHIDVEDGDTKRRTIEKLSVVDGHMKARVKDGILSDFYVQAGDEIRFTYTNAMLPQWMKPPTLKSSLMRCRLQATTPCGFNPQVQPSSDLRVQKPFGGCRRGTACYHCRTSRQ